MGMVPPADGSPAARPRRVPAPQSVGGRNFAAETIETAVRAEHCQMLPPDTHDCLTSDDLVDIIERMLFKEQQKRYQSIADLRADLQRLYAAMQDCMPHLRMTTLLDDNASGYPADNNSSPGI